MKSKSIIPAEIIEHSILLIRGQKVMLDEMLAELYQVKTSALTRQVKRNIERFPNDFIFQLTKKEWDNLRCHFGISRHGGRRYNPYVFTEQGIAMLSSVLRSKRAIEVNIEIMRTFVRLRRLIISNKNLSLKLQTLEKKYDKRFKIIFEVITKLAEPPKDKSKSIGFRY